MKRSEFKKSDFELEVSNKGWSLKNRKEFSSMLKKNKESIYRFNDEQLKEFFIPKRKYNPIDEIELMASEPMSKYNRKAFSKYLKNKKQ